MSHADASDAPSYRGKLCTTVLESVRLERWGRGALGRAPDEHVEAIETCRGLSWLPASALDTLNGASLAEAGREGYVDFWRRYTGRTRDSVLFGPFVSGAFRIFGMRPEGFLRWVGRAWGATTRNYGNITFSGGSGFADLSLVDVPPSGRLATVAASLEGSLQGVLDLCRHEGRVEADEARLKSDGVVELRVSWISARTSAPAGAAAP
ncbi:MAG: hypothetical protein ACRBN8_19465 [Nannocystales bacterium]